jgi:chromate reductase
MHQLFAALAETAKPALELDVLEINSLPHFDGELDASSPPPEWQRFRGRVRSADAVLFLTFEYRIRIPGVLVNALEIGSGSQSGSEHDVWLGKPAAVLTVSLGPAGHNDWLHTLLGAQGHQLVCLPPHGFSLPGVGLIMHDQDRPVSASLQPFVTTVARELGEWIERHAARK